MADAVLVDHDSLSPQLKERRRQKMKYFASSEDLNKTDIMNFLQNEIKRKTSMNETENENENDHELAAIDIDSDCKDDFDSDHEQDTMQSVGHDDKNGVAHALAQDDDHDDDNDALIRNGEEPSWNELILDDSTRQQFEELAREYVGNIAEEKNKLQSEHYKLQQEHLKLQESNKQNEEHVEKLNAELAQKEETMMKLEQEITSLNVDKQTLHVDQQKLELQVQHNEETIENLNATISEYKTQNEVLSQNLNELTIKLDETHSPHCIDDGIVSISSSSKDEHQQHEEYEQMMNKVELAFKTNNKQMIVDIINSFKLSAIKTNDEINTLMQEKTKLNSDKNELEKEQQSLTLNNEALKNLVETHQERLNNLQKQYEHTKSAYNEMKNMNEQYQIDINAKNEFIQQLKQQNQKLESSNQELLIMNSDLRHELEMYDQTILKSTTTATTNNNNQNATAKQQKAETESNQTQTASHHASILSRSRADRKSFDENENENDSEPDMPSLILSERSTKNAKHGRSRSIPTSLYEQNLDLIVKTVNEDEYKFMEDLSKEKATLQAQPIRSEILKKCHSDAEKEFFFMNVLTCKLEISIKSGVSNPVVADISPQTLWLKAQQDNIPLHQFHEYIKKALVEILQNNKSSNERIKHHWSSHNSMIADQLFKQNDLNRSKQNNPHLQVYQNGGGASVMANKSRQERRRHGPRARNRAYTVSTTAPYSEQQTIIDEDEEKLIMRKQRNSDKMKQSIIRFQQEREKQIHEQHQQQIQRPTQEEYDEQLDAMQTEKTLNTLQAADTYDLL